MEIVEYSFEFSDEEWIGSTERTLFHKKTGSLILSDLHIGKAEHFRKNHLQIPGNIEARELLRLHRLFDYYQPDQLFLLGDIFHSSYNKAWLNFSKLLQTSGIQKKVLVQGNHDVLENSFYEEADLEVHSVFSFSHGIWMVHDAADFTGAGKSISGHLHPGCYVQGRARQRALLPCFFVGEQQLILPAFGSLTGLKSVKKSSEKDFYLAFTLNKFWKI